MTLKDIKEYNPIAVAEFLKLKGIEDEPYFVCWVPLTPRKQDCIIASVNSMLQKKTHNLGQARVPAW